MSMSRQDNDYKLILEKGMKKNVEHIALSWKSSKILFYDRLLKMVRDSKTYWIAFIWANISAYKDEEG